LEVTVTDARSVRKSRPKVPAKGKNNGQGENASAVGPALRKTGIRVMGEMPWGTNICVFYDSKEDLLDTCASYFEAGLLSDEFCIWAVSHPATEQSAKACCAAP
jgi:hypothetical protein